MVVVGDVDRVDEVADGGAWLRVRQGVDVLFVEVAGTGVTGRSE